MRLQKYPDGAWSWRLFIWSRHPKWSRTWTHSLEIDCLRPQNVSKRFKIWRIPGHQRIYAISLGRFSLKMLRQDPMASATKGA